MNQNGHCQFASGTLLYEWANSTREKWKRGNLEDEQIVALKRLGIERNRTPAKTFNTLDTNHNSTIALLRYLREEKPNNKWWAEARKKRIAELEAELAKAYENGLLVPATARKHDIQKRTLPKNTP